MVGGLPSLTLPCSSLLTTATRSCSIGLPSLAFHFLGNWGWGKQSLCVAWTWFSSHQDPKPDHTSLGWDLCGRDTLLPHHASQLHREEMELFLSPFCDSLEAGLCWCSLSTVKHQLRLGSHLVRMQPMLKWNDE